MLQVHGFPEVNIMNMQEIRQFARHNGLKPGKYSKLVLVRQIQRKEGNFDCFATAVNGVCDQYDCLWRDDCFAAGRRKQ